MNELANKVRTESGQLWTTYFSTSNERCDKKGRVNMREFDRITFETNIMGGRACIRGMRVTVSLILNLVADGMSTDEIIDAYPYIETEDIRQALRYAAWLAEETVYHLGSNIT